MREIKCNVSFCKWNKKGNICTHPNSEPGIMNEGMSPAMYCENYRKFAVKVKKLKKK